MDYSYVGYHESKMAAACLLLAMNMNCDGQWVRQQQCHICVTYASWFSRFAVNMNFSNAWSLPAVVHRFEFLHLIDGNFSHNFPSCLARRRRQL